MSILKISELQKNAKVVGYAALIEAQVRSASNGDYLQMILSDGKNQIVAKKWKFTGEPPKVGDVIALRATVGEYQGNLDLNVSDWKIAESDKIDPTAFLPQSTKEPQWYFDKLMEIIETVVDPGLQSLLERVYRDNEKSLLKAPAAKVMHHHCVGCLLQHTYEVTTYAMEIARLHTIQTGIEYHVDSIIAGACLHDIGKLWTYQWNGLAIEMTDWGQLEEHITVGIDYISGLVHREGLDFTKFFHLRHILASHHGQLDYGSPVEPKTPEAFIVHMADQLSAKLTMMDKALDGVHGWTTAKVFPFGSKLYKVEA